MKKFAFFSLFALLYTATAQAQISGFGIRPGVTLSTYKLANNLGDTYDASLRPGAAISAFVEVNLGNRFTVQPEIGFMQRGAHLNSESTLSWAGPDFGYPAEVTVTDYRLKETLNYVDFAAMLERNFGGGSFGGYIAAGPSLSFAVGNGRGVEVITTESPESDPLTDTFKYGIEMGNGRNDLYSGTDFSLNLGAGLIFILERGEIGLDLRYTHGLRALDTDGLKNRSFLVGVSYMHYLDF